MANEAQNPPRGLQQQPQRDADPQQQRAGSTDFQSRPESEGNAVTAKFTAFGAPRSRATSCTSEEAV